MPEVPVCFADGYCTFIEFLGWNLTVGRMVFIVGNICGRKLLCISEHSQRKFCRMLNQSMDGGAHINSVGKLLSNHEICESLLPQKLSAIRYDYLCLQ
jgi:hypothetical protein